MFELARLVVYNVYGLVQWSSSSKLLTGAIGALCNDFLFLTVVLALYVYKVSLLAIR